MLKATGSAEPFAGLPGAPAPEQRLLLACVGSGMGRRSDECSDALIRSPLNWTWLLDTAVRHGIAPLLWRALRVAAEDLPSGFRADLQRLASLAAARGYALTAELLRLLEAFAAAGIAAVPYKGPALAALAYGSLSLRPFSDLDLLIHEADLLPAKRLLLSQGYQPQLWLSEPLEQAYLRSGREYGMFRRENGVLVELQWRVTRRGDPIQFDMERLWRRLGPVALAGREVMTLSREDLLLVACVQSAKHCWGQHWGQLRWVADLAALVGGPHTLDWNQVMEEAARSRSERALWLGLSLASALAGATLPAEVRRRLDDDRGLSRLASHLCARMLASRDLTLPPVPALRGYLMLQGGERLSEQARHALRVLLQPTADDWAAFRLPASLAFLLPAFRPPRLLGKYGWQSLRMARAGFVRSRR